MSAHEGFRQYLDCVEMMAECDLAQFPMPEYAIDGRPIRALRANVPYVTLVGDVHQTVEFEASCTKCGTFFTFASSLTFPNPRFIQTCLDCATLRTTPESRAKAFETRCKNLGITQEEAHARRAKALGLDGMV